MQWTQYIIVGFIFGGIFFAGSAWALHWATKNGQLQNLEKGSKEIFDDEEPLGYKTDRFPNRKKK